MNLELPPERPLPEPDRMLERILSENHEESPRSRRPLVLAGSAVAAVIVIVVLAVGASILFRGRPPEVGSTVAPTPPTASSSPSTPAAQGQTRLPIGTAAGFPDFRVTVTQVRRDAAQGLLVRAEVCVSRLPPNPTGETTRISWDPWRIAAGERNAVARVADGSHPPAGLFPAESYRRVGECTAGWLPFADVSASDRPTAVVYSNSLGDVATWAVPR